ncbi:putative phosphoesterase [Methanococcus voltae]|uniref:Phosphoesterase n=2 Tax=Methanococcus voltae TaxID=2188 RepID=A0A8J7RFH3_METVO|nr:YfcE family phosphodiesterase [Methanococcus voltae]MBP2172141.1 putative phosphoesterase [Methanococcus voltae]MBP2200902.1 putative phosphoesterase [Methanococcus voltae]MCS3921626.1 putative phosphoesterase [Methanococcus voltae PS]
MNYKAIGESFYHKPIEINDSNIRIGIISDTHVPHRCNNENIPEYVINELKKVDLIIHCGDLTTPEIIKTLNDIKKPKYKLIIVKGNMDRHDILLSKVNLPKEYIFVVNGLKIGVIHGDMIEPRGDKLKMKYMALEKDLDVLISGHTHIPMIESVEGLNKTIMLLNPGSFTCPRIPLKTFMILDFKNNELNKIELKEVM